MKNMKIISAIFVGMLLTSAVSVSAIDWQSATDRLYNYRKPIVATALFYGAYKTYKNFAKRYRLHMRAIALDKSIKRYLTDAKIAEIARMTNGLSNGDLQGIINKIKTYASITEDGRATQEIINLAVKEYVDKHNAFKQAHEKKKAQ